MIEATQIFHQFELPGTRSRSLSVLDGVDLRVKRGEFVSILGPSGCGKSTLLRLVAGLAEPSRGTIQINGRAPAEARVRHEIGFVFQDPELLAWRNVEKNVRLPFDIFGDPAAVESKVAAYISLVGLSGFEKYFPAQLSGGMRSRVALARALVYEPSILLMDESFGSLDEFTRERMQIELLNIWQKTKRTILFVTHSVTEAVFLSDRVVVLSPRPATVARVVDIDLPRPRSAEMKESGVFLAYARSIRSELEGAMNGN